MNNISKSTQATTDGIGQRLMSHRQWRFLLVNVGCPKFTCPSRNFLPFCNANVAKIMLAHHNYCVKTWLMLHSIGQCDLPNAHYKQIMMPSIAWRCICDIYKAQQMQVVQEPHKIRNVQSKAYEGSAHLMLGLCCVQAKGDVERPRLIAAKWCAPAMAYPSNQHPTSAELCAQALTHVVVYDNYCLANDTCHCLMKLAGKIHALANAFCCWAMPILTC